MNRLCSWWRSSSTKLVKKEVAFAKEDFVGVAKGNGVVGRILDVLNVENVQLVETDICTYIQLGAR